MGARGAAALAMALALAACSVPPTVSESTQTWVAVRGQGDSEAPEELVLEIGETARDGYDGVVSLETAVSLDVRLVGRDSCRTYASLSAPAGTLWVIRFAEDGTVGVENWTGRGIDAGPALGQRTPSGCPRPGLTTFVVKAFAGAQQT